MSSNILSKGDGRVGEVLDQDHLGIVGVIIVRHLVLLVAVDGSDWESTRCICVQGALVLVSKCHETKHIAYQIILWDHMSLR